MTAGDHGGTPSRPAVALLMRIDRLVTEATVFVACCLLALASVVGLIQVVSRFILNQPTTWSETLVRALLIWMVYLGACGAMRVGAHVSVDILYRACRGRARDALEAFITLATLLLLAILVWFGWDMAYRVRFQNLAGLEISVSWIYAAIPVGSALSIVAVLAHYFDPKRQELETAV
jgi:TRAP-type C4-dicarboxylate transport system permease small subunit